MDMIMLKFKLILLIKRAPEQHCKCQNTFICAKMDETSDIGQFSYDICK